MGILGQWEGTIRHEGSSEALQGPSNVSCGDAIPSLDSFASIPHPNMKTSRQKLKIKVRGSQRRFYNSRAVPSPYELILI